MSQLVAVSSPASGREAIERAALLRRSFFPQRGIPRLAGPPPRKRIGAVIVYSAPIEVQLPPQLELLREARLIAARLGKRIRIVDIIDAAAGHFDVHPRDIVSHRRAQWVLRPRQVVAFLSKELTTRSLPEIGRLIGGRDHTTILHSCRKIAALIEAGDPIAADVEAIRARLTA